jgi:hypothetical protein
LHFVLAGLASSPTYRAVVGRHPIKCSLRDDKLTSDNPARIVFNALLRYGASPIVADGSGLTVKQVVEGMSILLMQDLVSCESVLFSPF